MVGTVALQWGCRYDAGLDLAGSIAQPDSPAEKYRAWVGPAGKVASPPDTSLASPYRLAATNGHVVFRDRHAKRVFRIVLSGLSSFAAGESHV